MSNRFERHELRRLDRLHQLGIAAALDAVADAPDHRLERTRVGVVVGLGFCALGYLEAQHKVVLTRPGRVNPLTIPILMSNSLAAHIAIRVGAGGPVHTVATACASGGAAIGYGGRLLDAGIVDRVIVVGAEAILTAGALLFFRRMNALSLRFDDASAASRPFDEQRDGFVASDGAASVVLERSTCSEAKRGVVIGYGTSCDASHIAAPDPDGLGARAAISMALEMAGIGIGNVRSINAHGTSTPLNDKVEAETVATVFGEGVPLTSIKGTTGHMIGASGVAEAIVSCQSATSGIIPVTAGTESPISSSVVTGHYIQGDRGPVVSNSFGFGGHNAVLVLGPADE